MGVEMSTQQRLNKDMKQAMKDKHVLRLSTIRLIRAAIMNAEIEKKGTLTEDEMIGVLNRELKQTKESLDAYIKADREALINEAQEKIAIIADYLPKQLDEEEVVALIQKAIEETGASGKSGIGKVMGKIAKDIHGKFDGKRASQLASELVP